MSEQFSHEHWMEQALLLASEAAKKGEVPVGAVVVLDNEIVGRGSNGPIYGCDPTAHAEIIALRDAAQRIQNYRLVDTSIYVTIEPCTMCLGAMVHARVKSLFYGAPERKSGVVDSNAQLHTADWLNHKLDVSGGYLEERCSQMISEFFAARRAAQKAQRLRAKA